MARFLASVVDKDFLNNPLVGQIIDHIEFNAKSQEEAEEVANRWVITNRIYEDPNYGELSVDPAIGKPAFLLFSRRAS